MHAIICSETEVINQRIHFIKTFFITILFLFVSFLFFLHLYVYKTKRRANPQATTTMMTMIMTCQWNSD